MHFLLKQKACSQVAKEKAYQSMDSDFQYLGFSGILQICKGVGERLANDQGFYCEQLKEFGLSKGRLRAGMIAVYECLHYSEGI